MGPYEQDSELSAVLGNRNSAFPCGTRLEHWAYINQCYLFDVGCCYRTPDELPMEGRNVGLLTVQLKEGYIVKPTIRGPNLQGPQKDYEMVAGYETLRHEVIEAMVCLWPRL